MDAYDGDEIVISGIGGHFPECETLDELKANLLDGIDMVTDDRPRWEPGELGVPVRTGQMKSLDMCDAQYFGLIGKQCQALDPITRKVLERSYEAVFDAGLNPADLAGSKTGVFFGTNILETEMSLMEAKTSDAYNILGRNKTMNANRISYCLDLKGPSMAVDSTWSSGLQAFALGFQFIQSGLCEAAFVSAGSSIIHPQFSKHFSELNLLSPDGISRPFDENANGFVRSEAVVVIFLQKLKNAKRNYGTVVNAVGISMNHLPGKILLPKKKEWLDIYQRFYKECNVNPNEVAFLEADGLACQEADTEELDAVCDFFCQERDASKPLLIGSVKSNVGHAMAASGMCSLAKILITNQTGIIPPNLNFSSPNKNIMGLLTGKMKVVSEATKLEGNLLAVNSFGFGGTYGHCLIRRPPQGKRLPSRESQDSVPRLVLASARNEEGMEVILNKIEGLDKSDDCMRLIDDMFSRNVPHHMCRGYTILPKQTGLRTSDTFQGDKRPVWFIFSGMGSHWPTMGKDLFHLPLFKESIDRCHNILKKKGLDLWNILTTDDDKIFDNIINSFVGISSIQIALVDILNCVGLKPDGIIGHSAGELGAAYADGCLTLEETILSSYSRGKVSNEVKVIKGMMAAVGKGCAEMEKNLPEDVEVACHNSSTNCTISGPAEKVYAFAKKLKDDGVFVKVVNVSNIAFHSKHIQALGPRLKEELSQVILHPKERSSKWVSSSVPERRWDEPEWRRCSAEYLTNNLLSPVYFEEACRHIPQNAIVLEIAPHSLLLSVLKRSLPNNCINLGLTHRNAPNQLLHVLQALGKLYTVGLHPRIGALYPQSELPVPLGTKFLGSFATWDHSFMWNSKAKCVRDTFKNSKDFLLHLDESPLFKSFKIDGKLILPYSVFLVLVLEVFSAMKKMKPSKMKVSYEDICFKKPIAIERKRSITITVMTLMATGKFEILYDDEVVVTGTVTEKSSRDGEWNDPKYSDEVRSEKASMSRDMTYAELAYFGYEYGEPLRSINSISNDGNSWESCIEWNGDLAVLLESLIQTQLLALNDSQNLRELKMIGELSMETSLLPQAHETIRLNLNAKTEVIHGKGINLKRAIFKIAERKPVLLPRDSTPGYRVTPKSPLKISFAEYFGGSVKWEGIGYSGTNSAGENIMGLASSDLVNSKLEPDPILSWQVPSNWKLEQAATVSIPYSLAYYMMKILADLRDCDTVLITNGSSPIGIACVTVALQYTKDVFVTGSSREEEQAFVNKFRQLKDNVITIDPEREDDLLLHNIKSKSKNKGVTFFISTCPATKLEKYLNCMTGFSHFFQIFLQETEEGFQFTGTDNLLKYLSIYGITLKSVLFSCESDKVMLKDFVARAMNSGIISPFGPRIISHEELHGNCERIGRTQSEVIRLGAGGSVPRFVCKSQSTYLVVSRGVNTGLLAAEWFATREAKNIVLLHSDKTVSLNASTKMNVLRESTSLSVKEIDSFDGATIEMSISGVKNVHAAVVFPIDDDREYSNTVIKFLEKKCLEPEGHVVCFLKSNSRAFDYCIERNRSGKPTLAVVSDKNLDGKWQQFVYILDSLLIGNEEGFIRLENDDEERDFMEKDIDDFLSSLPKNAEEVADFGSTLPEDVKVTEIRTLSLPYEYTKETLPIFLVEGIGRNKRLVKRFHHSLYPVFYVELPHLGCATVEELASYAIPKMRSIIPGPYLIIGEQWGGCLALEVGRQLERLGYKAHVFLVSGTPTEVVEPLRFVASTNEPLEVSLLSRLLQIKNEKVLQELSNQKNWKTRLNFCLQFIKEPNRYNVREGLDAIKCRLETLTNYSLKNPLNGPLTIITKKEMSAEHYKNLCRTRVNVYEVGPEEDILNDDIFKMIHDTAIHKSLAD